MNGTKRDYYATRRPYFPIEGHNYDNEGGGNFKCIEENYSCPIMQNTKSGWTFRAHGVGMYEDGKIDWDYSTDGHFAEVKP